MQKFGILIEESVSKNSIALFEPGIQKEGGHQRLKGIGHRMAQIRLMAQVGSMRVNHKMLEAESIGQSGQVPVLDQS